LQHGRVLPGLAEFILQRLRPKHCVTVPLEHVGFLLGSLHDFLQQGNNHLRVLSPHGIRLLKDTVM
jgi:hypothetical protein